MPIGDFRNSTFLITPLVLVLWIGTLFGAQVAQTEPIRLHPKNPHYFLLQGKAVALVTSGEHYGAVFNADFDDHKYLEALAAGGMNYTRVFGGSYVEAPAKSFGILRNDLAPARGRSPARARPGGSGHQGRAPGPRCPRSSASPRWLWRRERPTGP